MPQKPPGQRGEALAAKFLQKQGFRVIERNFKTRFGELDIIAQKGDTIHFIEVKTRHGAYHGEPYEAVNYIKIQHIKRAIHYYLLQKALTDRKLSLDVVSIILTHNGTIDTINHFQNIAS